MVNRERRLLAAVVTVTLLGCDASPGTPTGATPSTDPVTTKAPPAPDPEPAEPPPPEPPRPTTPSPPAAPPTAETTVAPVALPGTGLPPVTGGPAIRIESTLPIMTREVGGRSVPSVTLSSPTAQASLDRWFERRAYCRGRVQLAIDGFVSYHCTYSEPAAGGGVGRAALSARILPSGEVEDARPEDVFLPGTDLVRMVPVWADDEDALQGEMAFGPAGAVIVSTTDSDDPLHLPWRTIAPYIRADGPLGPALIAAGLTLAAPGTSAPPTPAPSTALFFGADAGAAIEAAALLPAAARASARLRVGRDQTVLLLPPGTDVTELELTVGARARRSWLYGALAEIVSVRAGDAVEIHESVGPRTPVVGALPAGAVTVAARGPLGSRVSEPGTGWMLVSGGGGAGGYASARSITLDDGCGAPGGSSGDLGGYAELAPAERFAWTLEPTADGAQTVVALFPVGSDCAIGPQSRRATADGTVTELRLVRATADGPEWLLVVTSAADLDQPARTVAVFGPAEGAAPLHTTTADAPVIRLAERRGPDRAPGYFPVTIAAGDARTWLRWNGTTLEALTP